MTGSPLERVRTVIEPILADLDLELFDLDHTGGSLVVSVDRPGGADLERITTATRAISRALDEADPFPGRYTLEVSSPGLERNLRTPAHYRWAIGRDVRIKLRAGSASDDERRIEGVVAAADDEAVTVWVGERATGPAGSPEAVAAVAAPDPSAARRVRYADIERARTVFEWGPPPKPGASRRAAAPAAGTNSPSASTKKKKVTS